MSIPLQVRTPLPQLGRLIARRLAEAGLPAPRVTLAAADRLALLPHGDGAAGDPPPVPDTLLRALGPLASLLERPRRTPRVADLADTEHWTLTLPARGLMKLDDIRLEAETPALLARARAALGGLGVKLEVQPLSDVPDNLLRHDGVDPIALALIGLAIGDELAGPLGSDQDAGISFDSVTVRLADPARVGLTPAERFPAVVLADDPARASVVMARLRAAGFPCVGPVPVPASAQGSVAQIRPGWLKDDTHAVAQARLTMALTDALEGDGGAAPQVALDDLDALDSLFAPIQPLIVVPDATPLASSDGRAGAVPLRVETDEVTALAPLLQTLDASGAWVLTARQTERAPGRVVIEHDGDGAMKAAARRLRADLLHGRPELEVALEEQDDRDEVPAGTLRLRVSAMALARTADPATLAQGYDLAIYANQPGVVAAVRAVAEGLGFTNVDVRPFEADDEVFGRKRRHREGATLKFGMAPRPAVEAFAQAIGARLGVPATPKRAFHDGDNDLWLYIPDDVVPGLAQVAPAGRAAAAHAPHASLSRAGRPALSIEGATIRIGDRRLARRTDLADRDLVPPLAEFRLQCLDQPTATILHHVATAIARREPCLLEGTTGTAKTSSVRWLAALCDQPVVRLNLSGQTDTGELIGRYAPGGAGWAWLDGPVLQAMTRGWWLLLDEVNLAEPQVLERLNPILERDPALVLTEHDNRVIGGPSHPVHPDFRVIATMNPAEYAGRLRLSPAWRDRFTASLIVPETEEADYVALTRYLATGQQPDLALWGWHWPGASGEAPLPALGEDPALFARLEALARFHAAVERAARGPEASLGGDRREPYVSTRRTLLAALAALAALADERSDGPGRADAAPDLDGEIEALIARYWLARMGSEADRAAVLRLAEATGARSGGDDLAGDDRHDIVGSEDLTAGERELIEDALS